MSLSRRRFLRLSGTAACAPVFSRFAAGSNDQTRSLCEKLKSDPLRPQFHLLPASNWMNDPNGPIFFGGRYHMFHQYNPKGAVWGNMHWAHAVSPDMVHWRHEPIAIAPTPDGFDRDGVFSGSAVLDGKVPTVIYTGVLPPDSPAEATLKDGQHVWREVQCLAVSHDPNLLSWDKLPNPVIAVPPAGLAVTGFRDPCVWREDNVWWLILGSGTREKGGAILLYRSDNLRDWIYIHPMIEGGASGKNTTNPVDDGDMWECPDFFPLGKKHVLLISTMGKVRWKVGTYKNQKFTAEKEGVVDHGSYYAAKTMLDREGNRILWGWIPETRPESEHNAAGWAGAMALPRALALTSSGELAMDVCPTINQLRRRHTGFARDTKTEIQSKTIAETRILDLSAELRCDLRFGSGQRGGLQLVAESGETFASVAIVGQSGGRQLTVNDTTAPLPGASDSPVHLHAFLDASVLEVFANGVTTTTQRIYRAPSGPLHLRIEGVPKIASLDIWQIEPISKNRLTCPLCD
jgi:beta-fructofuranosidase